MLLQTRFKYCFYCFFTDTDLLLNDFNVITDGIFDTMHLIDGDIDWDELLGNIEQSDPIGLFLCISILGTIHKRRRPRGVGKGGPP